MSSSYIEQFSRYLQEITSLGQADTARLISRCTQVSLLKNNYFLKTGDPVTKVGYLAKGIIRQFIIDKKGTEIISQFISEGHFFTDRNGFYERKSSGSSMQALTDCQLLVLSISELDRLKEEIPLLKTVVAQISEQSLREQIKTEEFLRMGTATEQYQHFMTNYPHLVKQVPLKYIASYLRITPQSLSRIRKQEGLMHNWKRGNNPLP